MPELVIKTYAVGMLRTNCYVIYLQGQKEALLFDPGDEAQYIIEKIEKDNLTIKGILLTHGHFDHIYAADELKTKYHTEIYAHQEEKEVLEDEEINCSADFRQPIVLSPDVLLLDQDELSLAGIRLKVLHTPGHTKGSVCYLLSEYGVLISGDTLFYETVGATHFPTGSGPVMFRSLNEVLMKLADQIKVYPGHGEPTTIGHERQYNPYVQGNEGI